MKHAFLYFLRSALVPELRADITAGTARDVEFALIAIAAIRALPNEFTVVFDNLYLAVETALLAIVGLRIELGIHYVVVYEFHYAEHRFEIVLHIGHFDVRYRAAGRQRLELALYRKLIESVYLFRNVYMIAVGNVALVGNSGNRFCRHFANL